jgi:hypothetical protein
MRSIVIACCMVMIGSAAAYSEEMFSQRFRVAQDRVRCLLACDDQLARCLNPCGADSNCNGRCYNQQGACQARCNR